MAEGSILPDTGASEASIWEFVQTCAVHLQDLDQGLGPRQAIPLLTVRVKGQGAINTWRMETEIETWIQKKKMEEGDRDRDWIQKKKKCTMPLCGFDPPTKGVLERKTNVP